MRVESPFRAAKYSHAWGQALLGRRLYITNQSIFILCAEDVSVCRDMTLHDIGGLTTALKCVLDDLTTTAMLLFFLLQLAPQKHIFLTVQSLTPGPGLSEAFPALTAADTFIHFFWQCYGCF